MLLQIAVAILPCPVTLICCHVGLGNTSGPRAIVVMATRSCLRSYRRLVQLHGRICQAEYWMTESIACNMCHVIPWLSIGNAWLAFSFSLCGDYLWYKALTDWGGGDTNPQFTPKFCRVGVNFFTSDLISSNLPPPPHLLQFETSHKEVFAVSKFAMRSFNSGGWVMWGDHIWSPKKFSKFTQKNTHYDTFLCILRFSALFNGFLQQWQRWYWMTDLGDCSSFAFGMLFLDGMPGMAIRDALVYLHMTLMAVSFP